MFSPDDYAYELSPELIAQSPVSPRPAARMLVVDDGGRSHRHVRDLPGSLPADALVVVNDTRVVPSRIYFQREDGRLFELLVTDPGRRDGAFGAWVRGAKRLRRGEVLHKAEVAVRYVGRDATEDRECRFELVAGDLDSLLESAGELPLPPYISRPDGMTTHDRERYQTVFARDSGSVAAPTAGLHFDTELLAQIDSVAITLHVGPGTFLPMQAADVRDHRVGSERYEVSFDAAARIERARAQRRPIVAVGTTVTRTLEHVAKLSGGAIVAGSGRTDLVIRPGHHWRVVDALVTNLHLPRSSLLMLTCTFGGRERIMAAYEEAVRARYRFYSYGDCMLICQRGNEADRGAA